MRTVAAVLLLGAASADELGKARDALRQLDFPAALSHLAAVEQQSDLEPAQLAELYELQGVANATLKKKEAVDSFRKLLVLVPDHKFDAARAPRVMTPYYEARDWVKQHGALAVKAIETRAGEKLTVELSLNDALGLAQGLTVKVTEDGATRELTFKIAQLPARVSSTALKAELSVTVLGVKGQRLQVKAFRFERPQAVPTPPPMPPPALTPGEPRPEPAAPVAAVSEPAPEPKRFLTGKRVAGIVLLGLSAAAFLGGGSQGWLSVEGRQRFQRAVNGTETLTRMEADELNGQVQQYAIVADGLFAAGGGLALTGLLLLIFGGSP